MVSPEQLNDRLARIERRMWWHSIGITIALILSSVAALKGQDLTTPEQAIDWAIAHQSELPNAVRPMIRYLWIPPWGKTDTWFAASSFAINSAASQAGIIVRPQPIANGWMLAVDLTLLAPESKDLAKLIETWDSLATEEPYFHAVEPQRNDRGELKNIAVVAPYLDSERADTLSVLNGSPSLVYRVDWFLTRILDREYYRFMQFPGTLDAVLKTVGVDVELAKRVDGDQRVGIFTSDVTGKPRRIDRVQGAAGRVNTGAVWITRDLFDGSVDTDSHPIYNLLEFQLDGSEVIFERQNGMHGFVLSDAAGDLVNEAPPNLVSDHTIPAPHTARLRPSISCIRCHGEDEGLKPARNDVRTLLTSGTDIIGDFGNLKATREENVLRLAGLYAGDFSRRIKLGRDDYTIATRKATVMPAKPEGLNVVEASDLVSDIYGKYLYDDVDTATACRELGYDPGEDPVATLGRILPHLPPDRQTGIVFEDPTIAALRAGISVRRADWESVYPAARLQVSIREEENEND